MTRIAQQYRTIWISDTHLGTRGCKADYLLDFLRRTDARTIYLAGDIVDGWRLRKSWYWPQSHNDIVQEMLRKVRAGTRIIYVPGNHDEWLRDYVSLHFGGIEVVERRFTSPPTAAACWSSTATGSTSWSSMRAGWRCSATMRTRLHYGRITTSTGCAAGSAMITGRCRRS